MRLQNGQHLKIPANVPGNIALLIDRCWAMEPDQRPSMEEVAAVLKDAAEPNPMSPSCNFATCFVALVSVCAARGSKAPDTPKSPLEAEFELDSVDSPPDASTLPVS